MTGGLLGVGERNLWMEPDPPREVRAALLARLSDELSWAKIFTLGADLRDIASDFYEPYLRHTPTSKSTNSPFGCTELDINLSTFTFSGSSSLKWQQIIDEGHVATVAIETDASENRRPRYSVTESWGNGELTATYPIRDIRAQELLKALLVDLDEARQFRDRNLDRYD